LEDVKIFGGHGGEASDMSGEGSEHTLVEGDASGGLELRNDGDGAGRVKTFSLFINGAG
jgi:hypothetical protein